MMNIELPMQGWKTWVGVAAGLVVPISVVFGFHLSPEQIAAIQTISVSIIAVGLGSKADKAKKSSDAVASQTAVVANEVRKVAGRVPALFVPDEKTGEPKPFVPGGGAGEPKPFVRWPSGWPNKPEPWPNKPER